MSSLVSFMPLKILPESYRRKKKKNLLRPSVNVTFSVALPLTSVSELTCFLTLLIVHVVPLSCQRARSHLPFHGWEAGFGNA